MTSEPYDKRQLYTIYIMSDQILQSGDSLEEFDDSNLLGHSFRIIRNSGYFECVALAFSL